MNLKNKNILIGVTGSIAAYKVCYLIRSIKKAGGNVKVILTDAGEKFITTTTLETLSENRVYTDMFDYADDIMHINLIKWADCFVIYPATANTISKIATGIADNLITSSALSWSRPIIIAPAMNVNMYRNENFQHNLKMLRERDVIIVDPVTGELACGDFGEGKLVDEKYVLFYIDKYLSGSNILKDKKVLITTGPTIEDIDPVRYISNRSSGKMGYNLALAAFKHSAEVTLISGPSCLEYLNLFPIIKVRNSSDMKNAVEENLKNSNVIIMVAAVCDYKPQFKKSKLKKTKPDFNLELHRTEDILNFIGERKTREFVVGFSVETENEIENSLTKMKSKNLDMIIVNNPLEMDTGFEVDTNKVTVISRDGEIISYPLLPKKELAETIIRKISYLMNRK